MLLSYLKHPLTSWGGMLLLCASQLFACDAPPQQDPPEAGDIAEGGAIVVEPAGEISGPSCESASDCDAQSETSGYVCDQLACRPCDSDRECQRIPYYGEVATCVEGRCVEVDPCDEARGQGCACDADTPCASGFICDEDSCQVDACAAEEGAEGCPCIGPERACAEGLLCNVEDFTCRVCDGEAGCPCPCDEGFECIDDVCQTSEACVEGSEGCACSSESPECSDGLTCLNNRCQACEGPQEVGCACVDDACEGLVCDTETELCREALTCADIECVGGEMCVAGSPERDASCGECQPGFVREDGRCVPTDNPADCSLAGPDSILTQCADLGRDCVDSDGSGPTPASCSEECADGYLPEGGVCRARLTCMTAGCGMANRVCVDTPPADATCGECLPGYELEDGCVGALCQCAPIPLISCEQLAMECAMRNQRCEGEPGAAECTTCLPGFIRDASTMECRAEFTCVGPNSLECESTQNRPCIEPGPGEDAYCDVTRCVEGFVTVNGADICVPEAVCLETSCAEGEFCRVENNQAICDDRPCPDNQAFNEVTEVCQVCPPCEVNDARTGNVGPYLVGGNCICETQPGYFWRTGNGADAIACDEDADGWVSQSAYQAFSNPNNALREQARCTIRNVSEFELRPESGAEDEIITLNVLNEFGVNAVPLVETDRNDRQEELEASQLIDHPNYAHPPISGGRQLRVEELNPLTKFCVDLRADFNDDGKPDVAQGQNEPAGMRFQTPALNSIAARLSYFAELHYAYYEEPGRYVIVERSRLLGRAPSESVAMHLPTSAGDYWRECHRYADRRIEQVTSGEPSATFDFSSYWDDEQRTGMTHHSQFKCLAVVNDSRPELLGLNEKLHFVARSEASNRFNFQSCLVNDEPRVAPEGPEDINPVNSEFTCTSLGSDDPRIAQIEGFVAWATVPYMDYAAGSPPVSCQDTSGADNPALCPDGIECLNGVCADPRLSQEYVRGCISECAELPWLADQESDYVNEVCSQYRAQDDPRFACGVAPYTDPITELSAPDSGRLVCGCALSYGGEACSVGCGRADEAGDVGVSASFDLATRDGVWMCASFNGADGQPQSTSGISANQWTLWGAVPYSTIQRSTVLQGFSQDGSTLYQLY